jgi:uncharacterized membrane protein YheB (UPF0754 family)
LVDTTVAEWFVIPLISALIGYVTNVVAVRMLFRPRRPWGIQGVWTIQGLIPRRHHDLAKAIGNVVEKELLSVDALLDKLNISGYKSQVLATVVEYMRTQLKERLPWYIPNALKDTIVEYLSEMVNKEGEGILDQLVVDLESHVRTSIDIRELVENRILALDLATLEELIIGIAHKELRYIEVLGAVLGLLIGVGQTGLLAILR